MLEVSLFILCCLLVWLLPGKSQKKHTKENRNRMTYVNEEPNRTKYQKQKSKKQLKIYNMKLFVKIIVKLLWTFLIFIVGTIIATLVRQESVGFSGIIALGMFGAIIAVWSTWKKPEQENSIDKHQLNKD